MARVSTALVATALVASTCVAQPIQQQADDAGTIYRGALAGQDWGRPLAAGDLDGDGFDELIIGASESWGGSTSRVYVLRGGPTALWHGVVDLSAAAADQVIVGAAVDDNLGCSMATGDVNGDEIDDLLLCASGDDSARVNAGAAYLIFGGPAFFDMGTRELAIEGNWDMRLLGPVENGDMGGQNAFGGLDANGAAIGFVNDDTYGDMILGVHLANGGGTQSGRVYVRFGGPFPSGFTLDLATLGNYSVRIDGAGTYDELGTAICTGDLTGDGLEEIILGNEYASRGLFTSEGAVHIFRGRALWPDYFSLATATADITLRGAREDDYLGVALAAGDFDNDGIDDLAAAASGADAGAHNDQRGDGFVYGLLGSEAYQNGMHTIEYATDTPDFVLIGEFEENLGAEVSAGDFNGDGYGDIAASERFGGPSTNGVVEVLLGRDFSPGATFTADVDTDLHVLGSPNDRIGFSLAAGDTNGDGLDEILIGTPFNNGDHGTVYVLAPVSADLDHDGDVDLRDIAGFQLCFAGSAVQPGAGCGPLDFDLDGDVDGVDLDLVIRRLVGPN